jgi:hypothetical protein
MALPDELAHVELTDAAALGGAGVAEVGVVGPDDDLGLLPPLATQMDGEGVERVTERVSFVN